MPTKQETHQISSVQGISHLANSKWQAGSPRRDVQVHVSDEQNLLRLKARSPCIADAALTYECKDTRSALGVEADHPVAEHGEEEGRHHPHGHNVKQQYCGVVGPGSIRACISLPTHHSQDSHD